MILPRKRIDFDDLRVMSLTIWGEARGETIRGKQAVGCVIINRWLSGKWFNGVDTNNDGVESISEVCQQDWQFSCWNKSDANLKKMLAVQIGDVTYDECISIALKVIEDSKRQEYVGRDPSRGATHYYVQGSKKPKWHTNQKPCAIIGKHGFFNNIT